MDFNKENSTQDISNKFNLRKTLSTYLSHWKWFVISCLLFLVLGFLYLRYTIPEYSASAKIMILADETGSSAEDVFKDLSLFSETEDAKIEDEIYVIKSRNFLRKIIKKLNLNVKYYTQGRVLETQLYKSTIPIDINFIASDSVIESTSFIFYIDITSSTGFNYRLKEDDVPKKITFGENISTHFGGMIITPKRNNIDNLIGNTIRVKIVPVNTLAESLKKRITVLPSKKSSKVLNFGIQDPIEERAKDIINTLIAQYNISTIEAKNIKSKNTADFIDKRVELIASDLVNVDDSIVRFKTGNKVTNVASEAGMFLSSSAMNEQELDANKTQLSILNYAKDFVNPNESSYQPIPSNLGMEDPTIAALSTQYNELLRTRDSRLKSAGEKNAIIVELDETIDGVRQTLLQNIENSRKALSIRIGSLERQSDRINSKIFSVPGQEKKLRSIERTQGIKESLYLYLLQKREEATISLTATSPNARVIDEAYSSGGPVFPNKGLIYAAALFLGLFIPFSILYIDNLLDTKIHNKEDLENEIKNITVLGEIPKVKNAKNNALVEKHDRSILSESFRIIRTNLDFVRRGRKVKDYDNVLFVTSTINGEGKSFFSMNMALTLANTGKRVLLVGADIRNPQIYSAIDNKNNKDISKVGLTEYLVDKSIIIGETINSYDVNGIEIDILLSGKVPPNPAELLLSDRIKPLFDSVSNQYDYVIVDTAPSMLVTDTLLISEFAGHTIYLTRADYTEKQILNFAKELHTDKKLNGMMLVVNDVKQSNFGYGAKYGYYGASKKKSFFKRKV